MNDTLFKWAAYIQAGQVQCTQVEVHETEKTFLVLGDRTAATGYRSPVRKDLGLLHDTKEEALRALAEEQRTELYQKRAAFEKAEREFDDTMKQINQML